MILSEFYLSHCWHTERHSFVELNFPTYEISQEAFYMFEKQVEIADSSFSGKVVALFFRHPSLLTIYFLLWRLRLERRLWMKQRAKNQLHCM